MMKCSELILMGRSLFYAAESSNGTSKVKWEVSCVFLTSLSYRSTFSSPLGATKSLVISKGGRQISTHSCCARGETRPTTSDALDPDRRKKEEESFLLHRDQQLPVKTKWVGKSGRIGENGVRTRDFWRDRPAL